MKKKLLIIGMFLCSLITFGQNGTLTVGNLSTQNISGAILSQPNGFQLDGNSGYLSIPDNDNLDFPGTPFTVEMLVKIPTTWSAHNVLFNKGNNGINLFLNADGTNLTFGKANTSPDWGSVNITNYKGKTVLIHFIYNGTNAQIYINGVSKYDAAQSTNLIEATSSAQYIGCYTGPNFYYTSEINSTRLYNRALTASEVTAHFNNGFPDLYVMPYADRGASQAELCGNPTFGSDTWWVKDAGATIADGVAKLRASVDNIHTPYTFTKGKRYRITYTILNYVSGNLVVAGASTYTTPKTANGTYSDEFISDYTSIFLYSTGTTNLDIDNVSIVEIGNVLSLEPQGVGHLTWEDKSGNSLHAAVSGGAYPIMQPDEQIWDSQVFTTDIQSGTANKDVSIPVGYEVVNVACKNNTAGNITLFKATDVTSGFTYFDTRTIESTWNRSFYSATGQYISGSSTGAAHTLRFNGTGNTTGGIRIIAKFRRVW